MTPRLKPEEARKLLGGYATGTLTDGEREALFAAALEDQSLFDALAEEDALRELLESPGAKTRLLASIKEEPATSWFGIPRPASRSGIPRMASKPRAWSFAGLAAIAALTVAFLAQKPEVFPQKPAPVSEIAQAPAAKPKEEKPERAASDRTTTEGSGRPQGQPASQPAEPHLRRAPSTSAPFAGSPSAAGKKANADKDVKPAEVDAAKETKQRDESSRQQPRREEAPTPPPAPRAAVPPPVVDVPTPAAPKLADAQPKPAPPPAPAAPPATSQETRAAAPPIQQFRPAPSQQAPASISPLQQSADALIKRKQDATSAKSAGPAPEDQKEAEKTQDKVASGRSRVATNSLANRPSANAQGGAAAGTPIVLRYKLQRPEGGDAPMELNVEASTGFVYILRRTGSGWDTVASGNGPHALADSGQFAVVASRTELANPATAIGTSSTSRNIVTRSGDGFTSIASPESSVAAMLRVPVR